MGKFGEFVQNVYQFRTNLTEFRHLVHWDRMVLRKTLPISTWFPPHTVGRADEARPKKPFHLVRGRIGRKAYKTFSKLLAGS